MEKSNVITAQTTISDMVLISASMDDVKELVETELTRLIAKEIVRSKNLELTEEPDFRTNSKRFRAQLVVLTPEEYNYFKRIEKSHKDAKNILNNW